jgi:hypothetical protein
MDKKDKVPTGRLYASIAIPFIWLLFLAFWLFFYVVNYSVIQNIGIFLASIVLVAILEVIIWVPWGMKQK